MKRVVVAVALLCIAGLLVAGWWTYGPYLQTIYALGSRTVEYGFVIIDADTEQPIALATVDFWSDSPDPEGKGRKKIARVVTGADGRAKFVRENNSVEDVIGIKASNKLQGIKRHPEGVGTFVDRFWCTMDVSAAGYPRLETWLGEFEYEDKGYVKDGKYHQVEFIIPLRRVVPN